MRRRYGVVGACIVLALFGSVAESANAGAIPASACTHAIVLTTMAFGPGTVHPGATSTARLSGMNCTRHAETATLTWLGHYAPTGASGCPIIDPIAEAVSVPASTALRAHLAYLVPATCTAKLLTVTARLATSGGVVANKSADLHIVHKRTAQPG